MKIRTDFVTNSSSSNFTVEIEIKSSDRSVWISENRQTSDSGTEMVFSGDLRNVNSHLSSVKELASWLSDCIHGYWEHSDSYGLRRKKEKFVRDACKAFKSVRDIEQITVERHYDAWGEMADLIADNDKVLVALARDYLKRTGSARERAAAAMITHIQTTTDARGENFGKDSVVSRYQWDGKNLNKLAQRLCSSYGPDQVTGVERKTLYMKSGLYYDTSDFDLH